MKTYSILLILLIITGSTRGQVLDTLNGNIVIFSENNGPIFHIPFADIKQGQNNIKVKEKLGSYNVKLGKTKDFAEYRIIRKTEKSILWKHNEHTFQILLATKDSNHVRLIFSASHISNQWEVSFLRQKEEIIYGGGIQFSEYDNYNKKLINLTQENGLGRGGGSISKWTKMAGVAGENYATYTPSSRIITNQDRSFEVDTYAYSEVLLSDEKITFHIVGDLAEITLGFHPTEDEFKNITKPLPYQLPKWSTGTILGLQGGSEAVLKKVNATLNAGAHIDAVWIQDWVGKRKTKYGSRLNWTWELDQSHYADFEKFKSKLNEKSIHVLGYVNPFFAEEGKYITEGLEKGYFIYEYNTDTPRLFDYGGMKGYMLDIFNEEAFEWMKSIIKTNLIDNGFEGWMADFAEWYPVGEDQEFIIDDFKKHNEYPVLWAKLNYEVIKESGKELFFFNRSGGTETSNYSSMMWAGDQMVDYSEEDGLLSVFDAYLSSAHSALPMIHSDAGGYTSVKKPFIKNYIRDTALLKDWLFLEACTPVLRTHEGLLPEDNSQVYDASMTTYFAQVTQLHKKLQPYFEELITDRNENGESIFKDAKSVHDSFDNDLKSFAVGNDLVIFVVPEKQKYGVHADWTFVSTEGNISVNPISGMKIQVLVRKTSELFKTLQP